MKPSTFAFGAMTLFAALAITVQTFAQNTQPITASQTDPKAQAKILDRYGKLPLSFEANHGQPDNRVRFLSRGHGYSLFLTGNEAVIALKKAARSPEVKGVPGRELVEKQKTGAAQGAVVRMELAGANPRPRMVGAEELPGKANYFIGNDPAKWRTNVPTYAKVKYEGVYPGVDLVYYGNQGQLEYDFVVAPGVDPNEIRLKFRGAGKLRLDEKGDLLLGARGEEVRFEKPVVYQEVAGEKKPVEGSYVLASANRIGFQVGEYDHSRPLVIDPVLVYSTYLGGSGFDLGFGIAVDSSGDAYMTGEAGSTDFPTTTGAFQTTLGGSNNAFVTKLNATGSALVYSTYLGGNCCDIGFGIAVDSSGNAFVTGQTSSLNFPTTTGAFQTASGGGFDVFVTKLNATGSALVYSTYLGGAGFDGSRGIAVDSSGNAYVGGETIASNLPTTTGAFQTTLGGGFDVFVTKLNATGSALVYSTYLGGSGDELVSGIALDSSRNAYVTGYTSSFNFPTTTGAFQTTLGGGSDVFVTKLNATGSALVYSTYLGAGVFNLQGIGLGGAIAVDFSSNAYVTGETSSTNFPTTPGAFQATFAGGFPYNTNAFVTKLNATGSALVYSTYLGGNCCDVGLGIALDSSGDAYITGRAGSTDFPTTPGALQTNGGNDAFMTKLNATGSALVYSTYLGGSAGATGTAIVLDSSHNAYVTGYAPSNFPTTPGAFQTTSGGGERNAFVAKMAVGPRYSVCLLYDPTKAVHSGATIPIKLQLCDSSGNDLSSSSITVHATSVTQISTSTSGAVENSGNSNPDNDFRFDATLGSTGGYIFNLKTTGLSAGTYNLNFTVTGDSFVYAANFEVK